MTTNALHTLATPALVLDRSAFEKNLRTMATARPGRTLRPHVKAHKCTSIAWAQVEAGHASFTCATPLEVIGLARAGVGDDVLLANECLDPHRLAEMARAQHDTGITITVAVDSPLTIERAAECGISSVLIDVISETPAISPRRRSSGAATAEATVAGSAPGSDAETCTIGESTR